MIQNPKAIKEILDKFNSKKKKKKSAWQTDKNRPKEP